ncbi:MULTISPECIES: hypothetical protein [unclassified Cryobacterium]|uniref:hypothetical protein n=1 Tax=unclassified Cryobacterium TaxID=2649013 RepID=UPI00106963AE|nr:MULTISPECIES: hypothetical protein [unclassified Cryobacterium]TFC54499.1 hypothetical protein E3O68_09125 [Cryobacterium sp. TMB3-1-2]TFC70919.1 hypothetical protein E3T21_09505 [Cryobacterium sp. TMB3-15]TFC77372.1 hypothetical protein E3T22_06625 [Cryobacterium sp. TMB3-10]TFD45305.1 hypothetical protein E3T58_03250 [Cryobacterium sp. TMB3-12]
MRRRQIVIAASALVGALAMSGCTGSETAPSAAQPSATSTTDTMTCTGFNDVLTITSNADAGLRDGRIAAQEQEGWYRLATRVLDGVPTSGDGAVSEAADALKNVAPAIDLGAMGTSGIGSAEWDSALEDMSDACSEANAETAVEMFTGG